MSQIIGTIYAQVGDGWQSIGTTEGGVTFTGGAVERDEIPRVLDPGPYEMTVRMAPGAAEAVLALLWQPGDPLYDQFSPGSGVSRLMVQLIDDGDATHHPMRWWPEADRFGPAAEPGPWSWLQPGTVRHA